MTTSTGITASMLYTKENGVLPVKLCGVVWLAYSILGNSLGHLPFASSSRCFILVILVLFIDSAYLLACGWGWVEYRNCIFHSMQKFCMAVLMNEIHCS